MKSNPCPASWGDNDFDPYMCGDDLILPKQEYNNDVVQFINAFKPPGLDDFEFISVADEDPAGCWNAKAYSSYSAAAANGASLSGPVVAAAAVALALLVQLMA